MRIERKVSKHPNALEQEESKRSTENHCEKQSLLENRKPLYTDNDSSFCTMYQLVPTFRTPYLSSTIYASCHNPKNLSSSSPTLRSLFFKLISPRKALDISAI